MKILMTYLLYFHIFCGSLSLILFWIPAFTLKGGPIHRKVGKIYIITMWCVVVSATILSINNVYIGQTNLAIFLGFLGLFTAYPLWHGMAVLRNKKSTGESYRRTFLIFALVVILASIALVIYGIFFTPNGGGVLMIFFGALGMIVVPDLIQFFRSKNSLNWYREHYRGMIISGIAAYTAFLAFGGRRIFGEMLSGIWQIAPWFLPTVIGVVALRLFDRYYRKRGIVR